MAIFLGIWVIILELDFLKKHFIGKSNQEKFFFIEKVLRQFLIKQMNWLKRYKLYKRCLKTNVNKNHFCWISVIKTIVMHIGSCCWLEIKINWENIMKHIMLMSNNYTPLMECFNLIKHILYPDCCKYVIRSNN